MFCSSCGRDIGAGSFCPSCGAAVVAAGIAPVPVVSPVAGAETPAARQIRANLARFSAFQQNVTCPNCRYTGPVGFIREVKPFYALVVDDKGEKLGRIPLTENLNDALRDLWNAEELTNKVFWIDQICIDQEGEEKSHQVAMMGQIYRNAARVITYLGPAEDEEVEREGLQLLERLDRHFAPNYEILAQWDDIIAVHYGRSELPVSKLPGDLVGDAINERVWKWLVSLCFGEWALRLWIAQEQLLNADNLMLHGSQVLSWEAVVIMPTLFYLDLIPGGPVYALWETRRPELSLDPWEISGSLFYIWQAHHLKEKRPEAIIPSSITLFANMARFEGLLCRDPR